MTVADIEIVHNELSDEIRRFLAELEVRSKRQHPAYHNMSMDKAYGFTYLKFDEEVGLFYTSEGDEVSDYMYDAGRAQHVFFLDSNFGTVVRSLMNNDNAKFNSRFVGGTEIYTNDREYDPRRSFSGAITKGLCFGTLSINEKGALEQKIVTENTLLISSTEDWSDYSDSFITLKRAIRNARSERR